MQESQNHAETRSKSALRHKQEEDNASRTSLTRPSAWRCPICKLPSEQVEQDAVLRHLEGLHKLEIDERIRHLSAEPARYWQQLVQDAFAVGQRQQQELQQQQQQQLQQQPQEQLPSERQFVTNRSIRQNTFGNDFDKLRIGPDDKPGDQDQRQHITYSTNSTTQPPTTMDDVSQAATVGRHNSASPGSRPRQRQGSSIHRSKPSRSVTRSSDNQEFHSHTRQSREASREVNTPTSDAHDDARRKRQSGNTQSASTNSVSSPRQQVQIHRYRGAFPSHTDPRWPDLILQPASRIISEEQLADEVRAIYQVLTTLESKCIECDKQYAVASQKGPLPPNTWRALIGMHRRLLNDHHDFFLASQHPSASEPLHRLALKYNMPARMWKHGIHVFLELLRHQLPHSIEFMVSFIYMAYQMVSLLLETVPSFKETWIECLGDLSRYRMAVEEDDMRDREQWGIVARYWYSQASDKLPNTGRLYHHLAILARPDALQQNHLFAKSLIATQPFISARESIQTLYDPIIKGESPYVHEIDALFVKTSGFNFYRRFDQVAAVQLPLTKQLDSHIANCGAKWKTMGIYVASVTIATLLEYGNQSLMLQICQAGNKGIKLAQGFEEGSTALPQADTAKSQTPTQNEDEAEKAIVMAESFFFSTFAIVFARKNDANTFLYATVVLCFIVSIVSYNEYLHDSPHLHKRLTRFLLQVPWTAISDYLNALPQDDSFDTTYRMSDFPQPAKGEQGRLQEDFALRGMVFAANHFPQNWFNDISADDERMLEPASMNNVRVRRLRWLGHKLSEYECLVEDDGQTLGEWRPNSSSPWTQGVARDINHEYLPDSPSGGAFRSGFAAHVNVSKEEENAQTFNTRAAAIGALQKGKTTLVIDNTLVPENMDILKHLATSGWDIFIPVNIWHKLQELSRKENGLYSATVAAVQQSSAQIVNAKGEPVFTPPSAADSPGAESEYTAVNEDDWLMVKFTKRASDDAAAQAAANQSPTKYAIITDADAVQRHAKELKVPYVTSADVRAVFMHNGGQERAETPSGEAMDYSMNSP